MGTTSALTDLRGALVQVDLPFTLERAEAARRTRRELLDQLDDYILPRLERLDAPLLAVLGGSTGAGKSTITNSLVGSEVSTPGVLRPTTRTPVLVCHPDDERWFMSGGVLADLPRSTGERPIGAGLHIETSAQVPAGLAILDSPDIDSIEVDNHDLAGQLLGGADLWLFVTTAARYADAVPWEYLARAKERSIALSLVVNRLPPGAADEVVAHLTEMLVDRGLGGTQVFAIQEESLEDGMLGDRIAPVREWLASLAADTATRAEVIRSSLDGAIASIGPRVERVADAMDEQAQVAAALASHAEARHVDARNRVDQHLAGGAVLRGEVLGQWQEIVGTGELMGRLQQGVRKVRDGITSIFSGSKVNESAVRGELKSNIGVVVREAVDRASLETVEGWEALPGGREALAPAGRGIDRASDRLLPDLERELEVWQQGVFELVRELAGPKLNLARTLTFGINSVGLAAMIAVFSSTGGLTGGEAAVAGGTAAMSQAILSAIFGEQAIRDLVALSRDDLGRRVGSLVATEEQRFMSLLSGTGHDLAEGAASEGLRNVALAVAQQS